MFYDAKFTNITIGNSVTTIGKEAFYGCDSLENIIISESVTSIGDKAFYNCTGELTINCKISDMSEGSDGAFYAANFTKITIGDNVTSIGRNAFAYCSLINVTIGDSVTRIGQNAFKSCSNLTSVTIPNSVTEIGESAFQDCRKLASVTIGDNVTWIGSRSFYWCNELQDVYCKPITPPSIYAESFSIQTDMKIYVSGNAYNNYMQYSSTTSGSSQSNWYKFRTCIEPYDFE